MKPACATLMLCLACATTCLADDPEKQWTYDGRFHKVIADADRIVVREPFKIKIGEVENEDIVEDGDTLFEVTKPSEVKEVYEQLQFQSPQKALDSCLCDGYPWIEWYKGKERRAFASVQHGLALRWDGFPGDARFTKKSSDWIANWLARHEVFDASAVVELFADQAELKAAMDNMEKEARQTLHKLTPSGFIEAADKGAAEFQRQIKDADPSMLSSIKSEGEIKAGYIRAAVRDKGTLFPALFRLLGCLPMKWEVMYRPEQREAYEFLIQAPQNELGQAIQSAVRSNDLAVRQGAARVAFLQPYTIIGDELEKWMEMLAGTAYADPLPENRRLVVRCLAAHPKTRVIGVLERAAEDPDDAVRRETIEALRVRGSPESVELLRRIAAGKIQPHKRPSRSKDYAQGVERPISISELRWNPKPDGTDQEAASKALQAISR